MSIEPDEVTVDDPMWKRLWAYSKQRFPLVEHGVMIVAYVLSNTFVAQALQPEMGTVELGVATLMAAAVILLFFLHLRVFDEHKDYEADVEYHPDRVLQRGVITLKHLKVVGFVAIGAQLGIALWHSPAAAVAWGLAFGYSLLMLKEFFCREWLEARFLLYAITHLLVMPLLALVVYGFATGAMPWEAPEWFYLYALLGFFVMFNWEISRKVRAPEDEVDGIQTYTKVFGTRGAGGVLIGLRVVDVAMAAAVGWAIGLGWGYYAALVAVFVVILVGNIQYLREPTSKRADRMETYAGLYIVLFHAIVAVAVAVEVGISVGI